MQIQDGQIHALINQKDGMVRFLEDPEQYKTSDMIEVMDSVIQRYVSTNQFFCCRKIKFLATAFFLCGRGRHGKHKNFDPPLFI